MLRIGARHGRCRLFGNDKVRYGGLKKNKAQLMTLFVPPIPWMVRRNLSIPDGQFRPQTLQAA